MILHTADVRVLSVLADKNEPTLRGVLRQGANLPPGEVDNILARLSSGGLVAGVDGTWSLTTRGARSLAGCSVRV